MMITRLHVHKPHSNAFLSYFIIHIYLAPYEQVQQTSYCCSNCPYFEHKLISKCHTLLSALILMKKKSLTAINASHWNITLLLTWRGSSHYTHWWAPDRTGLFHMPHKLSEDPVFHNTCQLLGYHKTGFLCRHRTDNLMYKHKKWKQQDTQPTYTF